MKGLILCLAIGLLIVGFSSSSFAGGAVSVQWGNDPKPDCEDGGGKYKKKEVLHPMHPLMDTGRSTSTGTTPTAMCTMTRAGTCIFT